MSQQFPNENRVRFESSVLRWVMHKLARLDTNSLLALVDQAAVSAMSLIASVVVGRNCGADGLGIYSLAITIVILLVSVHTAVVSTPYTVFRTRIANQDEASFAGSSLVGSLMVTLVGVVLLLVASTVFYFFDFVPTLENVILALSALIPFLLLREFARRYAFAHLNMSAAVAIDVSVASIQLASLLLLARFELLTPTNALMCLGSACGIASLVWLYQRRSEFAVDRQSLKKNLAHKWVLGRWVLLEHILAAFSALVTPWLLVFLIDSTATGIFAACMIVVNLSSPFLQGMGNSLGPKFAAAGTRESTAPIRKLFYSSTLFMTGTMAVFVLVCFFAGETIMQVLFKESDYRGQGWTVTLLAVRAMLGSANMTAHHALLAMEKPLPSLYCSLIGLIVAFVGGLILIPIYGILGGAMALLVGTILEVISIYWGYILVLRNYRGSRAEPESKQVQP